MPKPVGKMQKANAAAQEGIGKLIAPQSQDGPRARCNQAFELAPDYA